MKTTERKVTTQFQSWKMPATTTSTLTLPLTSVNSQTVVAQMMQTLTSLNVAQIGNLPYIILAAAAEVVLLFLLNQRLMTLSWPHLLC